MIAGFAVFLIIGLVAIAIGAASGISSRAMDYVLFCVLAAVLVLGVVQWRMSQRPGFLVGILVGVGLLAMVCGYLIAAR